MCRLTIQTMLPTGFGRMSTGRTMLNLETRSRTNPTTIPAALAIRFWSNLVQHETGKIEVRRTRTNRVLTTDSYWPIRNIARTCESLDGDVGDTDRRGNNRSN